MLSNLAGFVNIPETQKRHLALIRHTDDYDIAILPLYVVGDSIYTMCGVGYNHDFFCLSSDEGGSLFSDFVQERVIRFPHEDVRERFDFVRDLSTSFNHRSW